MRQTYLHHPRPPSSARGFHHVALLSSDVERTVGFYQDVLGFPLTEIFENRDYKGSNHFFFDVGHGNLLKIRFDHRSSSAQGSHALRCTSKLCLPWPPRVTAGGGTISETTSGRSTWRTFARRRFPTER